MGEGLAVGEVRVIATEPEAAGLVCGSRTIVIPACASPRLKVTPKKKRKAETAAFMEVAEAPFDLMCS